MIHLRNAPGINVEFGDQEPQVEVPNQDMHSNGRKDVSQQVVQIFSAENIDGISKAPKWKKKKKVFQLLAATVYQFPQELRDLLSQYGADVSAYQDKKQLLRASVHLLINNPDFRNAFTSLATNIAMDLEQDFAGFDYANLDLIHEEDPGYIEDLYAPDTEKGKTFFGKVFEIIQEPIVDVLGTLFKPGQEQEALTEAEKALIALEQQKLQQQKEMTNYVIIGVGVLAAVIIGVAIYKQSKK